MVRCPLYGLNRVTVTNWKDDVTVRPTSIRLCQLIEQGATDIDYIAIGAAEGGYGQLLYRLTRDSYQLLASSFPTILAEAMRGVSIEQLHGSHHPTIRKELTTYPSEIPLKLV